MMRIDLLDTRILTGTWIGVLSWAWGCGMLMIVLWNAHGFVADGGLWRSLGVFGIYFYEN